VLLTTHLLLAPRSWKSRAIPLPTLWATTGPVTGLLYFTGGLAIISFFPSHLSVFTSYFMYATVYTQAYRRCFSYA